MAQVCFVGEPLGLKGREMLRQVFQVAVASTTALLSGPVCAERPEVIGAGTTVCGEFASTAAAGGLSDTAALQWVFGYVSGRAAAAGMRHRAPPAPERIARQVLAYCQAHPYGRVVDAAASVIELKRYCRSAHTCD